MRLLQFCYKPVNFESKRALLWKALMFQADGVSELKARGLPPGKNAYYVVHLTMWDYISSAGVSRDFCFRLRSSMNICSTGLS